MVKCPNCGAELPGPSHIGLRVGPSNYLAEPIQLRPGTKYDRYFSLIYLPPKQEEGVETLERALVIASEERSKETQRYNFIAGSKFYRSDLQLLSMAVEQIIAAEIAFTAMVSPFSVESVFNSRLKSLYGYKREELAINARIMLENMRRVDKLEMAGRVGGL